ncbi:MAG TPA: hypothetical protein VGG60_17990 [Candidatus Binataceae bacterium]
MKDLSSRWAVAILLAPVLLILGLALSGGNQAATAAAPAAGKGTVAIAFQGTFANSQNVTSFQRVALNVVSIRLNPSTDADVSDFDSRWVTIPVPAGVGRNTGVIQISTGNNFGGSINTSSNNNVAIGTANSEIQIDLKAITGFAQIFNAANITAQTYNQAELVLDSATPGNIVPLCASALPVGGEGCISYPAKLLANTTTPTPSPGNISIRTTISNGLIIPKNTNVVIPLVIAIDPGIVAGQLSASVGQAIVINPVIAAIPINPPSTTPPFLNPALGTIQGIINTTAAGGFSNTKAKVETITAEISGTNNIIESVTLPSTCNGKKTCTFYLYLPAGNGGTNYDLVASGKGTSYAVRSKVPVNVGVLTNISTTPLAIITRPNVTLTGKVSDPCTGFPIQAATLNLLVPDPLVVADCTTAAGSLPPAGCVVAATGSSDEAGKFPLPGNGFNEAPFDLVPLAATKTSYELMTTAAGYDRTVFEVEPVNSALKCDFPNTKAATCNFTMSRGTLSGTVSLSSATTTPLSVLVAAEDTGTNNIENLSLVTIPANVTNVPFSMNVPDSENVGTGGTVVTQLDLFASAQDLFNGSPQVNSGHTIAVLGGVAAPAPPTGTTCAIASNNDLSGMTCVGHSSVSGQVGNPDFGDTVVLSKSDVDIESVPVIPPGQTAAGAYTICAPADPLPYTLTHEPAGGSTSVTLPTPVVGPSPGATPCPSICDAGQGTSCLTCLGETGVGGF